MQYKKVFTGNFPRGDIQHNNGKFNPYFVTDVEVSTTDPLKAQETYILCYDADTSITSDLSGFGHDLQTSVQGPQYCRQADGSYVDIGSALPVDIIDGKKWVRSCGAVTNLMPGDTSVARAVTLTAQKYTLQVFGSGTATCSYGTASIGAPLTFTATPGSPMFTPSSATLWSLSATPYPVPYTPPGTSMPASNTLESGTWFVSSSDRDLNEALSSGNTTLAVLVRLGTSNAGISAPQNVLGEYITIGPNSVAAGTDETTPVSLAGAWQSSEVHLKVLQTNQDATQYRVGNKRVGFDAQIAWSAWAVLDGSFKAADVLRLGLNTQAPLWFNKVIAWNGYVSESRITEAMFPAAPVAYSVGAVDTFLSGGIGTLTVNLVMASDSSSLPPNTMIYPLDNTFVGFQNIGSTGQFVVGDGTDFSTADFSWVAGQKVKLTIQAVGFAFRILVE